MEKYLLFKPAMWYHLLMPLNSCIGGAVNKHYLFIHHSRFLRFPSCPTPVLSFPASRVPVYTVCVLFCSIPQFALFQFELLYLMGFAIIPPVHINSWCVCWVSFTEILTLRSHSSVVITISELSTAYFPPHSMYPCTFVYIWFCRSYHSVSWHPSTTYRVGLCLYSVE